MATAVQKIKCATMVSGLAKRWQSWADERSVKHETTPSGWVPDSILEDEQRREPEVRPAVVSQVMKTDGSDDCKIKTSVVTKSITAKKNDCGNHLVNLIKEKIDSSQLASEVQKPFLDGESPTRRRSCGSKASRAVMAWNQASGEESKMGSRSSSLDTDDSGLGEEAPLSDNGDCRSGKNERPVKKHKKLPKIQVTTMEDIRNKWQQWSKQHIEGQRLNPFSEEFDYEYAMAVKLQKGDVGYGRPVEGSKTEERARRAQKHIRREMDEMCYIIRHMGVRGKDDKVRITFGTLFDYYANISDKVVGILLRCRKHGMVDFEGEMLWQGRDDSVVITLLD